MSFTSAADVINDQILSPVNEGDTQQHTLWPPPQAYITI